MAKDQNKKQTAKAANGAKSKPAAKKPAEAKAKANPVGRPSSYREEYNEQARKLCLLGATDKELADFFEVCVDTITEWKNVHPEFSASVKKGKLQADAEVADRLYNRALGYEHDDVHPSSFQGMVTLTPIRKIYAPDPTAAIFWLKNRQPRQWRDKQETELTGKDGGPIAFKNAKDLTDDELAAIATRSGPRAAD